MQGIWDHTYSKELANEERDAENMAVNLDLSSELREYNGMDKVQSESGKNSLPWKRNLNFVKTYSRKLSFKDPDDSMGLTAIEPGCPEDNVRELRASEALKRSLAAVEIAPTVTLVEEHKKREIRELCAINTELRRQNKMLRIENFKLQLRLATVLNVRLNGEKN